MRPRVQGVDSLGGPAAWWSSVPPVTKLLATVWFGFACGYEFGLVDIRQLTLTWSRLWNHFEVWRLISNFFFISKFSPRLLFRLLWLFMHGPPLERLTMDHNPGEFAFMILFSMLHFDLISLAFPSLGMQLCGSSLVFTILYLWARKFGTQDVSIWGLFPIKAFYLPWALLAMDIMFGAPVAALLPDVIGIGVGHLYYFLTTLYPMSTGRQLVTTPQWLTNYMAGWYASSGVGTQQGGPAGHTVGSGYRAFQGRGRTLNG